MRHRLPLYYRHLLALLMMVCGVSLTGCTRSIEGPTVLQLEPETYASAFDAALATTHDSGFDATLRDRRLGVIETEPLISPSIFEPWKAGPYSFDQVMANTTSLQRRRVRWEFSARTLPSEPEPDDGRSDLLNLQPDMVDLTTTQQPIELRVAVIVERAYQPGTRPSVWTTSDTTRTIVIDPETGEPVEKQFWTPVARDTRFERSLLSALQQRLQRDETAAALDEDSMAAVSTAR